jgi:anti-sigma factor RsiW
MNAVERHCTPEELNALMEGSLPAGAAEAAGRHLAACASCALVLGGLERVDRALRRMPLERAAPSMTESVMRSIGVKGADGVFRVFEVLASLFGLAILAGITAVVLVAAGVIGTAGGGGAGGITSDLTARVLGSVGGAVSAVSERLGAFLPHGPSSRPMLLLLSVAGVLTALGLADAALARAPRRRAAGGGSGGGA